VNAHAIAPLPRAPTAVARRPKDVAPAPHDAAGALLAITDGAEGDASGERRLAARQRSIDALALLLTQRGDAGAPIAQALAEEPSYLPAHCLRAALIVRGDLVAERPALAASIAAIEQASPASDNPQRLHAAAARAWLDGDEALAAERYGAIIIERPRDILALMVAHALDFRLGRRTMLRDHVAQVLPEWHERMPGYASVLAMYAFGLEENAQYRQAEKWARRALALDPGHPAAIHVVTHVMEMQGRVREGLAFLAATEPAWGTDTGFSVHLAWHRALFHLDADDPAAALAVYDTKIAPALDIAALADASALLWRLQFHGVALGERWRRLADLWETHSLAGARPFFLLHAIMAFAATRRAAAAEHAFAGLPQHALLSSEDALAAPLAEALLAFARGDYAFCIERLTRVRHIAHHCGGSVAQCDVVHLTFTEAALRGGKTSLARALVAERAARKPGSRLNRRLQRRLTASAIAA
jgi:hypothetical protein